jgi:L-amino acid N-acyltransferase YncA
MRPPRVRPAEVRDAAAIAAIYNQGIEDRLATFETEPRTAQAIGEQLADRRSRYPVVVAESDDRVLGVAWTSEYRPRAAYAGVAEFSIYVAREARGQGIGQLTLAAVLDAAAAAGFWKLVSRIFPENLASRRLCAALGFREVGIYRHHARLDGAWRDCVIVERLLGPAKLRHPDPSPHGEGETSRRS